MKRKNIAVAPEHECTSWMVFADLFGKDANVLHKNRDAARVRNVAVMQSAPNSPRRWIGLGNSADSPCMGMNVCGLAGVMNSGELCVDPPDHTAGKSTPKMLRAILESCNTAAEAVEKLQELIRAGDYSHGKRGSIFFFLDPREGYICEITAKVCSVQRYDSGYAFRANVWRNPGMAQLSRIAPMEYLDSCGRESVVRTALNDALEQKNRIDLADMLALAREDKPAKDSPLERSIFSKTTNSAATLVIHREFPTVLSTMYVLVGQPRHTLYLPIPICAETLDCRLTEPVWSDAARARFEALGLHSEIPAAWTAFEERTMADYEKASAKALELLRKGDEAHAVRTLNRAVSQIWREAFPLAAETGTDGK